MMPVLFSASGSFHLAKSEMYKKALQAFYKLKKDFLSLSPGIKSSMHIFDHTLKPILLYNAEIWGGYNISKKKLQSNFDPDIIYKDLVCERLHLKFSKCILGVHKKSSNFAVLSELGRFSLHFDIIKSI